MSNNSENQLYSPIVLVSHVMTNFSNFNDSKVEAAYSGLTRPGGDFVKAARIVNGNLVRPVVVACNRMCVLMRLTVALPLDRPNR
jgi:hypothetical protein